MKKYSLTEQCYLIDKARLMLYEILCYSTIIYDKLKYLCKASHHFNRDVQTCYKFMETKFHIQASLSNPKIHFQNLINLNDLNKVNKIHLNCVLYYQLSRACEHQSEYMASLSNTVTDVHSEQINDCVCT